MLREKSLKNLEAHRTLFKKKLSGEMLSATFSRKIPLRKSNLNGSTFQKSEMKSDLLNQDIFQFVS